MAKEPKTVSPRSEAGAGTDCRPFCCTSMWLKQEEEEEIFLHKQESQAEKH